MLADGVDDLVSRALPRAHAVHDLEPAVLGGKAVGGVGHAGGVVGMGGAVHIVVHDEVGVLFAVELEQVKEAGGQYLGDDPLVQKLVDGQRRAQRLQIRHHFFVEVVFSHTLSPLPRRRSGKRGKCKFYS